MENKQTLEEAAEIYASHSLKEERQKDLNMGFKAGAKWQSERMYSEEEVIKLLEKAHFVEENIYEWFEKHKKK
jgi:hypothetical protein